MSLSRVFSHSASRIHVLRPGLSTSRHSTLSAAFTPSSVTHTITLSSLLHRAPRIHRLTSSNLHTYSHRQWNPFSSAPKSDSSAVIDLTSWNPSNYGLFGCALRQPEDFKRMEIECIKRCNAMIAELNSTPPSLLHMRLSDTISNILCCVIDTAEVTKNVHPDAEWKEAAAACSATLSAYMAELNHSPILYKSIVDLASIPNFSQWTAEQKRVQMLLKRDMDAQGIGAPKETRETIQRLLAEIHQHQFSFAQAHFQSESASGPEWIVLKQDPKDQPPEFHSYSRDGIYKYPMHSGIHLLAFLPSAELRKQVYVQYFSGSSPSTSRQRQALVGMVRTRQSLARALGKESFAAHTIANCVAGNEAHVKKLLTEILEGLQPQRNEKTREELRLLKEEKFRHLQELQGHPSESKLDMSNLTPTQKQAFDSIVIEPWDTAFYQARVRQSLVASSHGHALTHFFSFKNVLRGFQILGKKLFGLELEYKSLGKHESWLNNTGGNGSEADELIRLEVWQPATPNNNSPDSASTTATASSFPAPRTLLGVIYLDPYTRSGKFSNAASFGVRSGCEILEDSATKAGLESGKLADERQPAVVGIVCGLSRPTYRTSVHASQKRGLHDLGGLSSNVSQTLNPIQSQERWRNEITLLSHSDVEMLFHEFGHCLHNILSRTSYQHVAGARGELDFVEMPSTLFENFVSDYSFVSEWAKHYSTNQPIPESLVRDLVRTKHAFSNCQMIEQALMSLFDHEIHGKATLRENLTDQELFEKLDEIHHDLHVQYSPFHTKATPHSYPYLRLFHLTNYAASYYCYLYCRVFSSLIWERLFKGNPLQRSVGERFRTQLFQHGAGKDPRSILAELADADSSTTADGNLLQAFVEAQLPTFIQQTNKSSTQTPVSHAPPVAV